jgi:hypothetical protein
MDGAKKEKKEKENWGTRMVPSRGKKIFNWLG